MKYLLLILLLSACAPIIQKEYITLELYRPVRPILPKIKSEELQCLSPDVYQRLYDRQRLISGYALTLETIIDSTKKPEK